MKALCKSLSSAEPITLHVTRSYVHDHTMEIQNRCDDIMTEVHCAIDSPSILLQWVNSACVGFTNHT